MTDFETVRAALPTAAAQPTVPRDDWSLVGWSRHCPCGEPFESMSERLPVRHLPPGVPSIGGSRTWLDFSNGQMTVTCRAGHGFGGVEGLRCPSPGSEGTAFVYEFRRVPQNDEKAAPARDGL